MRQGYCKLTGVVLRRYETNEGDIRLYVFFRDCGPLWVVAPGAARGKRRFGGATEPLIWGYFGCYRSPNQLYLREVEVKEDHWGIRTKPDKLERAMIWARLLVKYLLPAHPCNDVLVIFYDSLYLLERDVEEGLVEWRFLYRWTKRWGLAPDISRCASCGKKLVKACWDEDVLLCERCHPKNGEAISCEILRELITVVMLSRKNLVEWTQKKKSKANYALYNEKLKNILERSLT
jgi:DNA repair protein RecO (recombination protein O)